MKRKDLKKEEKEEKRERNEGVTGFRDTDDYYVSPYTHTQGGGQLLGTTQLLSKFIFTGWGDTHRPHIDTHTHTRHRELVSTIRRPRC